MDFILIGFALLILLGCKYTIPKKQFDDYLGLESSKALRGIMAVAIIFHHISEKAQGGVLFPFLVHLGYLIVAVFFFLSGYGLFLSYNKKGEDYLKEFWKSRILSLVVIYLLFTAGYTIWSFVRGNQLTAIDILKSFVNGEPIAINSWYITVQILLYIVFWISFKIKTKNVNINILFVTILTGILCVAFRLAGYSSIWYLSNFAFPFGMVWAKNKEKIDTFMSKRYFTSVILSLGVFTLFSGIPLGLSYFGYDIKIVSLVSRFISSTAFVVVLMLILRVIKPSNKIWQKIGDMSLEIYLIHGAVFWTLKPIIQNDILWTLATVAISLILAYLCNIVSKQVYKLLK